MGLGRLDKINTSDLTGQGFEAGETAGSSRSEAPKHTLVTVGHFLALECNGQGRLWLETVRPEEQLGATERARSSLFARTRNVDCVELLKGLNQE